MYDSIDINEIDRLNINNNLIDIRDKYEYVLGSIRGSVNIPYSYISLMPENYLKEDVVYYIYCDSGSKSRRICHQLSNLGYKVVDLIGGYTNYHQTK